MQIFSRLGGLRRKLVGLIALFLLMLIGAGLYLQSITSANMTLSTPEIIIEVEKGATLTRVISQLGQKGLIQHPRLVLWYARLTGKAHNIKSGEYAITPTTSTQQFLHDLSVGKVVLYGVTFVEGWTFQQMLDEMTAQPQIMHTLQGQSPAKIMEQLGLAGLHPEGRFFPDTYRYQRNTSDHEILLTAYQVMIGILQKEWAARDGGLPYHEPYDALIMASIVEKETGLAAERPEIAGVFVRRLQQRMRLQSDPTTIYGMGASFDGNLRRKDLERDNPYNTYRRFGLPPTPIACPGREAIHAALHPDDSENLYFVARGDGSHQFSANLEAHNEAVIHYQLKGHRRPFSSFQDKHTNR